MTETLPPAPSFRQLHVALILLRFRAGKKQREVAREAGVGVNAVGAAEAGDTKRGSLETVDRLLTYYGVDLAQCHKLLQVARRHLGDLSQIRGPKMISRRQAEEICAQLERPRKPRPNTSWIRDKNPLT